MSPLDEAFHDWADAHEGEQRGYDAFRAGWEAGGAYLDATRERFWRHRMASAEAERDNAMMRLASCEYERTAFKRQRDDLAKALLEAKA